MELETIRNVVKETFRETFVEQELEYLLKEVSDMPRIKHINFIIYNDLGVCCEFSVSETMVFDATLKNDLARSKYELKVWLDFITKVEEKLRVLFLKELSSEE